MATLAEMFTESALKQNEQARDPNAGSGFIQGAQLALKQEELQQEHMKLQMQQQQLQQTKIQKLYDYMGEAKNYTNAGDRSKYLETAGGYARALGIPESQVPHSMIMSLSSDENQGRMYTLQMKVESGELKPADAVQIATDPQMRDKFAQVTPTPKEFMGKSPDLSAAAKEFLDRQSREKVASTRAGATVGGTKQLADFGNTVANPTSRGEMGQAKSMVNAADAIKQLTEAKVPPNATREQKVAAYNNLTPQQNTEIIRSLDRLLSRSNPTVHGQESLDPSTWEQLAAKYGQKALNTPVGAQQGEFILNNIETVDRERKLNADKFRTSAKILKDSKKNAKESYNDEMDQMIEEAIKVPDTGGDAPAPDANHLNVDGKLYDITRVTEILKDPAKYGVTTERANKFRAAMKKAGRS